MIALVTGIQVRIFFVEPWHRKVRLLFHLYGFTGPPLLETCTYGSFVTLSSGTEVLLVGCEHNTEKIFRLTWYEENLKREKLPQELNHPRTAAVAMLIPDSKTVCNKK